MMIANYMKRKSLLGALTLLTGVTFAQTAEDGIRALDFDRYEYARNVFTNLTQIEPTKGANYFYLGQSYLNLFKPDSALWAYNKGVQAEPNNFMNYVGLGELMLEDNKTNEAAGYFDKALSFSKGRDGKSKDVNALRLVAQAMISPEENRMIDVAHEHITRALELDKNNYEAIITAGDVSLLKNPGQAGGAADLYERAISLDPKNPKAYTRISYIWLSVKNAEATNDALQRALAVDAKYAPALKNLSEYYYQTRQFAKAKETYVRYLENSEPSLGNKKRFARILFRNKEYEETIVQINEILSSDVSDVFLYRLLGYSNYEVGEAKKDTSKYRPGAEALTTFINKVDPAKVIQSDYEYLAKLYSKIPGKEDMAAENINKAIQKDSSKVELYNDAGQIFSRIKKHDQAAYYFERYMSVAKKILPADYYRLGIACYNSKQYQKADSVFAKLIEIKPDYAEGYFWRGNAQQQIDKEAKTTLAKELYEKYLSLTEATPEKYKKQLITAYYYLGTYAILKDDNKAALDYVNKTLAIDPENADAKERKKLLTAPPPPAKGGKK